MQVFVHSKERNEDLKTEMRSLGVQTPLCILELSRSIPIDMEVINTTMYMQYTRC